MKLKISLVASAARPRFWDRLYYSCLRNKIEWELICVGPNPPISGLPEENFTYIKSNVKPAQCYEIGFRRARGTLVGWTADDADYNRFGAAKPPMLDVIWEAYLQADNPKTILAMRTLEDGNDVTSCHRFFFNEPHTPQMAPFGFINREWFRQLGGYDRNFVCGQSENDVVMRGLVDGGQVRLVNEAVVYVHHAECHGDYPFRSGYDQDREFLESCWVGEGRAISSRRLKSFMPFTDYELENINQGPAGRWETVLV